MPYEKDSTTVRVLAEVKERAEEHKREDESWSDYIDRCTDAGPNVQEVADLATVREAIREELGDA